MTLPHPAGIGFAIDSVNVFLHRQAVEPSGNSLFPQKIERRIPANNEMKVGKIANLLTCVDRLHNPHQTFLRQILGVFSTPGHLFIKNKGFTNVSIDQQLKGYHIAQRLIAVDEVFVLQ